jgi:hypothetical protein
MQNAQHYKEKHPRIEVRFFISGFGLFLISDFWYHSSLREAAQDPYAASLDDN